MSRIAPGEMYVAKPTNNVYTALAAAGTVAVIAGLIIMFIVANGLFPPSGLM